MAGPKITITITEANGEQQVINADYFIGCVHEEGEPKSDSRALGVGCPSFFQVAASKRHIDDLVRRMCEKEPRILFALLMHDKCNDKTEISRFDFECGPKESLT